MDISKLKSILESAAIFFVSSLDVQPDFSPETRRAQFVNSSGPVFFMLMGIDWVSPIFKVRSCISENVNVASVSSEMAKPNIFVPKSRKPKIPNDMSVTPKIFIAPSFMFIIMKDLF